MRFFDRKVEISLTDARGQGIEVDEKFRIAFRINKSLSSEANQIEVSIFNLSKETQNRLLQQAEFIQVVCGYESQTELLALGEISQIFVEQQLPNSILKIEAGDGIKVLRSVSVNVSFESGVSGDRILNSVLSDAGISKLNSGAKLRESYPQGFSFTGNLYDFLNVVTQKENLFWSIQEGFLVLLSFENPKKIDAFSISSESGLLGSPQRLDDLELQTNRAFGKGWRLKAFLNPKIKPGIGLKIDSAFVKGEFLVDSVFYSGDTRGNNWFLEAEVFG